MTLCDWYNDVMNRIDRWGNEKVDEVGCRRDVREINILLIPVYIIGFVLVSILLVSSFLIGRKLKKIIISKQTDPTKRRLYDDIMRSGGYL